MYPFSNPVRFRDLVTEAKAQGAGDKAPEYAFTALREHTSANAFNWRAYDLSEACDAIIGANYREALGAITKGAVSFSGDTVRVMESAPVTASAMQLLGDLSTFAMTSAARQGMEEDTAKWSLISAIPSQTITGSQAANGYRDGTAFGKLIDDDRVNELESAHYAQQRAYAVNYPTFQGSHLAMGITREMIEEDRTGEALRECYAIGKNLTRNKYNRILATLVGAASRNTFAETIGTTRTPYNTYLTAGKWVNVINGNAISDETQLQAVKSMLATQKHPVNENVFISTPMRHVLCTEAKELTMRRILNATEYRLEDDGNVTITTPMFSNAFQLFATPDLNPIIRGTTGYGGYGETTVGTFTEAKANQVIIAGAFDRALVVLEVPRELTRIVDHPDEDRRIVLGVHVQMRYEVCVRSPRDLVFNYDTVS